MEFLDYHAFDVRNGTNFFLDSFTKTVQFCFDSLLKETKLVVTEKIECEHRGIWKSFTLFGKRKTADNHGENESEHPDKSKFLNSLNFLVNGTLMQASKQSFMKFKLLKNLKPSSLVLLESIMS